MKFILEYAGYGHDNLSLPKGIVLTNQERMEMCKIIADALKQFYNLDKSKNGEPFTVDGITINPEYLSKAVNNRTLLKKIISDPNREIISGVNNKAELFNFVKNNTFDLFNHNGKYFRYVYGLLSSTSKKGKKFENNAFKVFREVAAKKGIDVIIEDPSLKEDIYGGIDGTFMYRGKRFTIQVKPLFKMETYQKDPTSYIIFCDGVLKELKTDYLIVTNEKETKVFRSKGITVFPSYFIAPKSNIID